MNITKDGRRREYLKGKQVKKARGEAHDRLTRKSVNRVPITNVLSEQKHSWTLVGPIRINPYRRELRHNGIRRQVQISMYIGDSYRHISRIIQENQDRRTRFQESVQNMQCTTWHPHDKRTFPKIRIPQKVPC